MERKYAVVVKVPGDGGYDVPYIIGNTASTFFDPQDVRIVTEHHQASLAAVQANDPQALKRIALVSRMAKQCGLTNGQFKQLIKCPLTREKLEQILTETGRIKVE